MIERASIANGRTVELLRFMPIRWVFDSYTTLILGKFLMSVLGHSRP